MNIFLKAFIKGMGKVIDLASQRFVIPNKNCWDSMGRILKKLENTLQKLNKDEPFRALVNIDYIGDKYGLPAKNLVQHN